MVWRRNVPISRPLFLWCEALATLALVLWLILPANLNLAFRVSTDAHVGVSLRQMASLLLLAAAGLLSMIALAKLVVGLVRYRS